MKRALLGCLLLTWAGCGDDDGDSSLDFGPGPDTGVRCASDADCDDGVFCNGAERCMPGAPLRNAQDCVAGDDPCGETDSCDEAMDMCEPCIDADEDGACAAVDCDDEDPARYPGNTEVCDAMGVDEDCDETTFGTKDDDEDGYVDDACCNDVGGEPVCGRDCDDDDSRVFWGSGEFCDGLDNDCNGAVDEGVTGTYYPDLDGDGFGDRDGTPALACYATLTRRPTMVDCDDGDPLVFPGAGERCGNSIDDNCDGTVDENCTCSSGETRTGGCPLPGRCRDADAVCVGGLFQCAASPGPVDETCNGVDDDCDGLLDEGVSIVCYEDADDDGWPHSHAAVAIACADDGRGDVGGCPEGLTNRVPEGTLDCHGDDPDISPDADGEVCGNLLDDDCNRQVDDGCED